MAAEDGVAVFSALIVVVVAEDTRHPGQRGQFFREIAAFGPGHALVHFVEADDVGLEVGDELADADQVDLPVEAFAVVDVVGEDTESRRSRRARAGTARYDDDANQACEHWQVMAEQVHGVSQNDGTSSRPRALKIWRRFVPLTGSATATALPRTNRPLNLTAMSTPASTPQPGSGRLMSVDALRGFDMFWIIAGDALVYALSRMTGEKGEGFSIFKFLAYQLEHADWAGFRFYDLIFPLFVFIVGVSIVFSLSKELEQGGRKAALIASSASGSSASRMSRMGI